MKAAEPLLRRLCFTGLLLGHRDPETADRFLWSLQREKSLARANLYFNAFHYGDLTFHANHPLPSEAVRFDRSVPHILRHLEQPELYRSILDTECVTLINVLETGGPRPFRRPTIRTRLRALLKDETLLQITPPIRNRFRRTFQSLAAEQ